MPGLTGQGSPEEIEKHLALKNGIEDLVLTGNLTLDYGYGNKLRIDANGANRTITLPAHRNGVNYHIVNTAAGAFNLLINDALAVLQVTLNQNEAVIIQSNGTAWKHMGVFTIAQS